MMFKPGIKIIKKLRKIEPTKADLFILINCFAMFVSLSNFLDFHDNIVLFNAYIKILDTNLSLV